MSIGHPADIVAGQLSHLLHGIRGPRECDLPDFERYLDLAPDVFFPAPPAIENVKTEKTIAERWHRTTTLTWRSTHEVLSSKYRRKHEGEYRSNQKVVARWLRPERRQRSGCLVYVHGWLEPGSWVEELFVFPQWSRELGVDILHVCLPFHGPRNPRGALFSGEYFWTADLVRSFEAIRQSIYDVRGAIAWLKLKGYSRVGAAGFSLGGSLAMLLACLAPTPDYVIPIVGHLMLGEAVEHASILWRIKRDLAKFGLDAPGRKRIFERIGFENYRPILPPEQQLWIDAREDAHIDPNLVLRQWEAWGRPNLHWIAGGHMTFPLHLPEITEAMSGFLLTAPAR